MIYLTSTSHPIPKPPLRGDLARSRGPHPRRLRGSSAFIQQPCVVFEGVAALCPSHLSPGLEKRALQRGGPPQRGVFGVRHPCAVPAPAVARSREWGTDKIGARTLARRSCSSVTQRCNSAIDDEAATRMSGPRNHKTANRRAAASRGKRSANRHPHTPGVPPKWSPNELMANDINQQ